MTENTDNNLKSGGRKAFSLIFEIAAVICALI